MNRLLRYVVGSTAVLDSMDDVLGVGIYIGGSFSRVSVSLVSVKPLGSAPLVGRLMCTSAAPNLGQGMLHPKWRGSRMGTIIDYYPHINIELRKRLQDDLVAAMKAKEPNRLSAIRLIKSKITYKDKEDGTETGKSRVFVCCVERSGEVEVGKNM